MSEINYTDEQAQAVFNLEDDVILGAGAGSGKTRVLVGRYLQLLESRKARINEILAITFTNKAADEMVERIRKEIMDKIESGENKRFWHNNLLELSQSHISTFHSFASGILRRNPVLAGIDPEFRVLEGEEAAQLLEQTINEVLEIGFEESDDSVLTLAREYDLYNLPGFLKEMYYSMEKANISSEQIFELTINSLRDSRQEREDYKRQIIELGEELIDIHQAEGVTGKSGQKMDEFTAYWEQIKEAVLNISSLEDKEELELIDSIPQILKGRLSKKISEQAKELKNIIKNDDHWISVLITDQVEKIIEPMINVVKRIETNYNQRKQEEGAIDFYELQSKLVKLLKTKPELLKNLQERFKYVMVDEFQDNSPVQEEIVSLIKCDSVNVFLVGDPKQSIYRFRGADVSVFNRQRQDIIERKGKDLYLTKNFRSRPSILNFVNYIFKQVMKEGEIDYTSLEAHRQAEDNDLELILIDKNELESDDYREEEAYALARRIKEMVEQQLKVDEGEDLHSINYGEISFLFQSLTNVELYEQALQAYNIPYMVVNGRGFYEQQEIKDILNLLKVIDNFHHNIPLIGLLRSPFCGISDEELYYLSQGRNNLWSTLENIDEIDISSEMKSQVKKLKDILKKGREWKDSLAPDQLIKRLLKMSDYFDALSASPYYQQQKSNITKLLAYIREYYINNLASIREIIQFIEEKREEKSREGLAAVDKDGSNLVQLMSIHQSKGLEFPVVVLPDCQRKIFNHSNMSSILFNDKAGLGLKIKYKYRRRQYQKSPLYLQLYEKEKLEEIAESKRLFYVALTRARDHLLISGSVKKLKNKSLDQARNWLDWLSYSFAVDFLSLEEDDFIYNNNNVSGKIRVKVITDPASRKDDNFDKMSDNKYEKLPEIDDWNDREQWQKIAPLIRKVPGRQSTEIPTLSVTAMQNYKQCPRQYYLKYVRGLPSYTPGGQQIFANNDEFHKANDQEIEQNLGNITGEFSVLQKLTPMEKGTLIHRLCELSGNLISNIDDSQKPADFGLPGLADSEQNISLNQKEEELTNSNIIVDLNKLMLQVSRELDLQEETVLSHKKEILQTVTSYLDWEKERIENDLLVNRIIKTENREQEFILKLSDFYLRGTIDHLICYQDGTADIIDLKTDKITSSQIKEKSKNYKLQLEAYALAVYKLWGNTPVNAKLNFLLPGEVSKSLEFDQNKLKNIEDKISELGQAITTSLNPSNFPQEKSSSCTFCQHGYLCQRI